MTDNFFDSLRVHPEIEKLYSVYEELSPAQKRRISRVGAKLWVVTDLSPAGAFELTMKLCAYLDEKEGNHDALAK
jgi:hypothetical protein